MLTATRKHTRSFGNHFIILSMRTTWGLNSHNDRIECVLSGAAVTPEEEQSQFYTQSSVKRITSPIPLTFVLSNLHAHTHTHTRMHACSLCAAQSSLQPDIWTSAPGQKQTNSRFYVHSVTVCCSYHQSSSDFNFTFGFIYLSFQQERRMRGGECARKKTGQEIFERKEKVRETGTDSADLGALSRIELKLFTEIKICLFLHLTI